MFAQEELVTEPPSSPELGPGRELEEACILTGTTAGTLVSQGHTDIDDTADFSGNSLMGFSSDTDPSHRIAPGKVPDLWIENSLPDLTWPWLHENLFLEDDAFDSWPEAGALAVTHSTNLYPNPLLDDIMKRQPFLSQGFQSSLVAQDVPLQLMSAATFPQPGGNDYIIANRDNRSSLSDLAAHKIPLPQPHRQLKEPHKPEDITSHRTRMIKELVEYAANVRSLSDSKTDRAAFWHSMSPKVVGAFDISFQGTNPEGDILEHFIELYLNHFGLLWPLLSRQNLDTSSLHPILYLVLTSIGAMYGGVAQSSYGAMMHNQLRKSLTMALELEDIDDGSLWLCQARLLTQVAALYFGQAKAFSYAQHLGGLLVAQARRMDLFSAAHVQKYRVYDSESVNSRSDAERFAVWLSLEARRRLAFGIFRADTYTSVLLNLKPLVSLDEIDLELPSCESIWRGERLPAHVCLKVIEQDRTLGRNLRFSDIYRIALDRQEQLPALEASGHELLLFGLQCPVWRLSRDSEMFQRLTGNDIEYPELDPKSSFHSANFPYEGVELRPVTRLSNSGRWAATTAEVDHLDGPSRQMADLKIESDRLTSALQRWKQSLPFVKTLIHSGASRSSLFSSLILYHLSYLRLNTPLGDLHKIQYRLADDRPIEDSFLEAVFQWANTTRGRFAAEHACNIWSLIVNECQRSETIRAQFNLLAFTGLHHAAVVLWSYAGAHDPMYDAREDLPLALVYPAEMKPSITICRSQTKILLASFVGLYDLISPARWSSFAKAATELSTHEFPLPDRLPLH